MIVAFLSFYAGAAFGAGPLVIDESFTKELLGLHMDLLEDREGKLAIADVAAAGASKKFRASNAEAPNFGYIKAAVWARFVVKNSFKDDYSYFLVFPQPWVDHVDLYIPRKGGYREIKAGDMLPFSVREVKDRNFIFPVRQAPGEQTYYARFKTTSTLSLNLAAYSPASLEERRNTEIPLLWLYYGLLVAMVLYNLLVFFSIRDVSYLYYVFSIFMLVLYIMSYNGTSFQYFWPESVEWANRSLSVFVHLLAAGFYLFTRSFLGVSGRMPFFNMAFILLAATHVAEMITVFFLGPGKADGLGTYTLMAGLPMVVVATAIAVKRGYRSARIYSIAWGVFLFLGGIGLLRSIALVPDNIFTHYSLHIGSSLAVILFSFGLADRINSMRDERMKALEALNQSEEKYRTLVESINDVIFMLDNEGKFTYISPAIERISRLYTVGDIVGRPFIDFIHPQDLREVIESRERTLSGDLHPLEYRLVDRDGRTIYVRSYSRPVMIRGEMVGIIGVLSDITEYKKMVDALNESEEKYRTLVENTTESIFVTQGAHVRFFNRSAVLAALYDEEEILTRPFIEFIHPDDRDVMMARYAKRIRGEDVSNAFQFRMLNKKGEARWMEINAVRITWQGEPAVLNFMTDVTERKIAEERLQSSLAEKELLLKEIHHRVKNNMQVISSLLNLQLKYVRDGRDREIFMDSQNRIRSMSLIHEKIYKSKDLVKINFAEYIQDLAYSLYRTYNVNQSMVKFVINAEDVYLGINMAIPCGLIINELVSNALKHAFPDGRRGEIYIMLTSGGDQGGDTHVLAVRDNGVGLKNGQDMENPETLGLQLVSTLVQQLKGALSVEVNGGTCFTVRFPSVR